MMDRASLVELRCKFRQMSLWWNARLLDVSAGFLLILVILTCEQVVARYWFSASSVAMSELQWYLFSSSFLLAIPATFDQDGHVRVDVLFSRMRPVSQRLLNTLGLALFVIPVCVLLTWFGLEFAITAFQYENPRPADYYSAAFFGEKTYLHELFSAFEGPIRNVILQGEISSDPGGLEGRAIVKLIVPFSFFSLLVAAILELIGGSENGNR